MIKEIHRRIDELASDIVNGGLLRHTDPMHLAREYARMIGEINGLLHIEKVIEEMKEDDRNKDTY